MQENTFSSYVTLTTVNQGTSTGKLNSRKEPLYLVKATATNTIGSKTNDAGRFTLDVRELDLYFTDLSERHLAMLTEGCEVAIFNAIVISYHTDIKYPISLISSLVDSEDTLVSAKEIIDSLTEKLGESYRDNLTNIIQERRRQTIIKVQPMRWRITASPAQLQTAQDDSRITEDIHQLL